MKFFKLLRKEISELFTKEIIISMIFTVVLLFAMGNLMTGAMQDIIFSDTVNIIDCDKTEFTAEIKKFLEENGYEVNLLPADKYTGNIAEDMKNYGEAEAILIPEGFTEKILNEKKPSEITVICSMKSTTSVTAMTSGASVYDAANGIEFVVEKMLYEKYGISPDDSIFAQTAVEVSNVTIAGEKYANVGVEAVASVTMMRNLVVVMMIFFLVLFASQMIITAIATEKIDKTLETLLSAPVSRMTIILSKMTAAAIVSVINAVAYMIGFAGYMSGMSAGMSPEELGNMVSSGEVDISSAIETLNFSLNIGDLFLIGLQMFMTILIALSVSIILGALAKDAKSTQTLVMPIMIAITLPFMMTLLGGSSGESSMIDIVMSIIPFTHTFRALDNIAFGNMTAYWLGFLYQAVCLVICLILAVRIFTTDKIFTVSLNFRGKKKTHENEE